MTRVCQKSEVTVDQTEVMAEVIEETVVETKAKSDESEEEGLTENTLPATKPEEEMFVMACSSVVRARTIGRESLPFLQHRAFYTFIFVLCRW